MWRGGMFAPTDAVEVIPGLHLGAAPSRRAARVLARAGVSFAFDLRADGAQTSPWPREVQTFSCPLAEYQPPDPEALRLISEQIASLIQSGAVVYVHCRAGVQRAPMVACAVLVQMGWTLSDAFRLVSSRRAVASMTEAQLQALKVVEASVRRVEARTGTS
jgi:protein-tyrosine phosphatase